MRPGPKWLRRTGPVNRSIEIVLKSPETGIVRGRAFDGSTMAALELAGDNTTQRACAGSPAQDL